MSNYKCNKCNGTTYNSTNCENPACPNLPCCGENVNMCRCNYINSKNHPELKDGEVLLLNVYEHEDWESNIPEWIESVRRGNVAYKTNSTEIVPNMKPLFAKLK